MVVDSRKAIQVNPRVPLAVFHGPQVHHEQPCCAITPVHLMLETSSISQDEGDQTQSTSEITTALKSPTNEAPPDPPQDQPMPTEYEQLTEQLQKNPHDPESWKRLVHLVHNSGETPKIRATYEALLKQYPNTVSGSEI